jgi:hypothetical protein
MIRIKHLWRAFLDHPTAVAWFYAAAIWFNIVTICAALFAKGSHP